MKFVRRTSSGVRPSSDRDHVDQALEVIGGFRPAGAAIRGDARRVGEDAGGLEIDVGDLVDADAHHQGEVGDEREDRIGADVGGDPHAERRDGAVVLDGGLEVGDLGAPVRRRHHVLDPRLGPPERHPVEPRERGDDRVFG